MKKSIALLILGALLGAAGMNTYLAARVDSLYIEREELKVKLYQTSERLKKTEAQWQSHQTLVVREIDVQFDRNTPDHFLALALRQEVTRMVQDLMGEKLESISPSLAVHLLDRRIVEADGQKYRLYVRTLILAEKLTYILGYELLESLPDDEP